MNNFKGCVHCVCSTGSGHKRSCEEQNISFGVETDFDPTKQNSDVPINADADVADTNQVVPIPCAKEATSELINSSPQAMSMFAKNVTSIPKPPNNPLNPSSLTDIPLMNEEKPGEKPEDEEMPSLVDITDEITR